MVWVPALLRGWGRPWRVPWEWAVVPFLCRAGFLCVSRTVNRKAQGAE